MTDGEFEDFWLCFDSQRIARAAHGTQLKNYIANAELRSEDPVNKWILRAVCLLTTTD